MELYHLSKSNLNGKTFTPRIPENYFTKNGFEDHSTPRVSFASSIDGAIMGLSQNCDGLELYVHKPKHDVKTKVPSVREVPDCKITGEIWVLEPVELECIGIIKVGKSIDKPYTFKYGKHTGELYKWKWSWKKRQANLNEVCEMDIISFYSNWRCE